jgi:hypothetical protein
LEELDGTLGILGSVLANLQPDRTSSQMNIQQKITIFGLQSLGKAGSTCRSLNGEREINNVKAVSYAGYI